MEDLFALPVVIIGKMFCSSLPGTPLPRRQPKTVRRDKTADRVRTSFLFCPLGMD